MLDNLSHEKKVLINKLSAAANNLGLNIYLAGGSIRDVLLKHKCNDLDIVVEGNGLEFAKFIFPYLGGEIKTFSSFMSATIALDKDFLIDISTAREEVYPAPGQLPKIKPSNIFVDLKRRDFTINSMALSLNNPGETHLIDPYNGKMDLEKRVLRVLTNNSFCEDPTRILRAARYSERLKLSIEDRTLKQLRESVKHLLHVSPSRLKNEFIKISEENSFQRIIKALKVFNALRYLLPGLDSLAKVKQSHIDFVKSFVSKYNQGQQWLVLLMLLYWEGSCNINSILDARLEFNKKEMTCLDWLIDNSKLIERTFFKQRDVSFISLHNLLFNTPLEVEIFLLSILDKKRNKYFLELRKAREGVEIPLNGKDLLKQGFAPGPLIGEILSLLELEVLKGNIKNRDEAFCWLNEMRDNLC
ncbi:MAG: CCA tRNA nucleotidyltransferase [Bacillota bacterium]